MIYDEQKLGQDIRPKLFVSTMCEYLVILCLLPFLARSSLSHFLV